MIPFHHPPARDNNDILIFFSTLGIICILYKFYKNIKKERKYNIKILEEIKDKINDLYQKEIKWLKSTKGH